MSDSSPDRSLDDFPASTGEIYDRIDEAEPISRQDLIAASYYSRATVDRALDRLERAGYIDCTRDNQDLRTVVTQTEY